MGGIWELIALAIHGKHFLTGLQLVDSVCQERHAEDYTDHDQLSDHACSRSRLHTSGAGGGEGDVAKLLLAAPSQPLDLMPCVVAAASLSSALV